MSEKPITLELFRHGNTFESSDTPVWVGSQSDLALTKRGIEQAEAAAAYLSEAGSVEAIYTGSLIRQSRAGEIIRSRLSPTPDLFCAQHALDEVDYGEWEGLSSEEILSHWPEEFSAWSEAAEWPHSVFTETLSDRMAKLDAWLASIRERHQAGSRIAAISSNGTIRFFYSFLGAPWDLIVSERRVGELKVKTGNYCRLNVYAQRIEVLAWNLDPSA